MFLHGFAVLQRSCPGRGSRHVVAAAIFFFTTVIFSAVTQLLWEWRVVDISDPSCTMPCALIPDSFFNFYTWHFLESIPLFKVNETLQLNEPLVYRGAAAGWLVVASRSP